MASTRKGVSRRSPRSGEPSRSIRELQRALATLTAAKRPEDAIRARARVLLSYLAHVRIPILIANSHAQYVEANRAATTVTGYARDELLRMSIWDLTPTPRRELGVRLWRAFLKRGTMTGRYLLRRKGGREFEADYLAVANVLPGLHVSALAVIKGRRRP
jgi:PAS domain S-box-containing protein